MEINNIVKSFGSKIILDNFSLSLPSKGVFCLFGESGCGKTTLLRIIAGLTSFESGEVIKGDLKKTSFVFQEPRLIGWLSALENVSLVLEPALKNNAEKWLELLGISKDDIFKYPRELSGGMQQRVAIARAIVYGGDLYLLDEPFKGIDPELKMRIMKHIYKEVKNSLVIMVTHDLREALEFADYIYICKGPPFLIEKKFDVAAAYSQDIIMLEEEFLKFSKED